MIKVELEFYPGNNATPAITEENTAIARKGQGEPFSYLASYMSSPNEKESNEPAR